jgi:hypothetical protein
LEKTTIIERGPIDRHQIATAQTNATQRRIYATGAEVNQIISFGAASDGGAEAWQGYVLLGH